MSLINPSSRSFTDRLLYPLEAAGFAAIAGLTRALPVDQASALSGAAWRRFAPLNRRHARAAEQLALSMPELDAAAREAILDGMWDNLGRTTAESFHMEEILNDPDRIQYSAGFDQHVESARKNGAVVVTLHLGNWELCAPILHKAGLEVAGVYQRIKNPHVDAAVIQLRSQYYRGGLRPKSAEAAREMLRIAGRGGVVGLLGDLRDFRGESVPFFNRPAPSSTFPALMARQREIPLLLGRATRLPDVRFEAEMIELDVDKTDDRHADVIKTTARIQAQFERWIRERPEQWMWGHRRWG